MKQQYLCQFHKAQLKANESEAVRVWSELMQRGVRAFVECRVEAAEIYLSSALDIAMLRSQCPKNGCFNEIHLKKPTEFLIQLLLVNDAFDKAFLLIHTVNKGYESRPEFFSDVFLDFIGKQLEQIEIAEKSFFRSTSKVKRGGMFKSTMMPSMALN